MILLGLFIAYPFVMGVWFSLSSISVGNPGEFVGLKNFARPGTTRSSDGVLEHHLYTFWATIFKLTLGMWLDHPQPALPASVCVRASMLLPFIIPTVLSTFVALDVRPTFSVLN